MELYKQILDFVDDFNKFRDSDEFKFSLFLKENRTTITILQGNYRDLINEFNYHNNPCFDDIHWHETSKLRWQLHKRIIRVLSNYLSSIFWVVDFSRTHKFKFLRANDSTLTEIKKIIKRDFQENYEHIFIQDLRDYISHISFLKPTTIKKITAENADVERNLFISKKQLLQSSYKWKSKSKKYIDDQNEEIYVVDLLRTHHKKFIDFQNLIYVNTVNIHKELMDTLIMKTEDLYLRGKSLNTAYILPFDLVYVRYLKYLLNYSAQHSV